MLCLVCGVTGRCCAQSRAFAGYSRRRSSVALAVGSTLAVLSLLLTLTGSGLAVGITLALRVFPRLLVGPLAGVLADRLPRKPILLITDFASAALALSFLLATSPNRVWLVYASTVALVCLREFCSGVRRCQP